MKTVKKRKLLALVLIITLTQLAAPTLAAGECSITIHKYSVTSMQGRPENTGELLNPATNEWLQGAIALKEIGFTVLKVVPMTGKEGSTDPDDYEADAGFEYNVTVQTDEDGSAVFNSLEEGFYMITEQPSDKTAGTLDPFIIQLPMMSPNGTLLKNVHIYPKNITGAPPIDKEVIFNPHAGSNTLTWKITVELPDDIGGVGQDYPKLTITDVLDHRLLFLSEDVYYTDKAGTKYPLTLDTHYTFRNEAVSGANPEQPKHLLAFTVISPAGFDELGKAITAATGNHPPMLVIEYKTDINQMSADSDWDMIENDAVLDFTNSEGTEYVPVTPPKPPHTYPYSIKIIKKNEADNFLSGAVFALYPTEKDAKEGTGYLTLPGSSGKWTETTDGNGIAEFKGLSHGVYWLNEETAPAGYNKINPTAIVIPDLDATGEWKGPDIESWQCVTVQVLNKKGFILPVTGGAGTLAFTLGGICLIGSAFAVVVILMKRKGKRQKLRPSAIRKGG